MQYLIHINWNIMVEIPQNLWFNAQFIASDLEYEVAMTLRVNDVNKICNSTQVGPSTSWALVLCTCCTIHCYATVWLRDSISLQEE